MPDISQIKTPDGTTYNLKDSRLDPILDETYSGYYATANTDAQKYFFFLKVVRSNYNTLWRVKMKVEFTIPSHPEYAYTLWDADIVGFQGVIKAYYIKVNHGQNRACRYLASAFPKTTTADEIYLGGNIYADLNYNSSDYARTIHVTVTEAYNCEVVAVDNFFKLADGIVTTTNFALVNTDLNSVGLQETGDANTTYSIFTSVGHGNGSFVADSVIHRYQLLFHTTEDKLTPLNNVDNGYSSTSKAILTNVEFDPFSEIFYYISTTNYAADAAVPAASLATEYGSIDLRYSLNISASVNALTAHKDVYMKVIPQSNGMVKLAAAFPLVQALPVSNDGYWYIYLGRTYSTYQMALYPHHEVYYHNGTVIVQKFPADMEKASTTNTGIVKLNNTVTSTSSSEAATAGAVKTAYDLAASKQNELTFDSAPTSSSTNPVTSGGVYEAMKEGKIWYGVCTDSGVARTVSIEGFTEYVEGMNLRIFFTQTMSPSNAGTYPTLNVNNLGAKYISYMSQIITPIKGWEFDQAIDFVYKNNKWVMVDGNMASTTAYGAAMLSNSTSSSSQSIAATSKAVKTTYDLAATKQNALIYSDTTPTSAVAGDVWLKPPSMTIEEARCLIVTSGAISSLPTTISDSSITSDMVVLNQTFTNPSAQVGDWTWETANGSLTLSGSITGTTSATFYLIKSR